MEPVALTTDMIKKLSGRERVFVDSFVEMLERDDALLDKTCAFIASKTNDRGLINDMTNLSSEGKRQACVEYVIIGLISGSIKVKDLSEIVRKYTEPSQLITGDYHGL